MKKLLFSAALLMGAVAVSFAGMPKDSKSETANNTEGQVKAVYYWYKVTYDAAHPSGFIPSGTSMLLNGDETEARELEECDEGSQRDCLRGFDAAPTLPTNSAGQAQIKTDEIQP